MEPMFYGFLWIAIIAAFVTMIGIRSKYKTLTDDMQGVIDHHNKQLKLSKIEVGVYEKVHSKLRLIVGPDKVDQMMAQALEDVQEEIKAIDGDCGCGDNDGCGDK